jgi:hypothetical protein
MSTRINFDTVPTGTRISIAGLYDARDEWAKSGYRVTSRHFLSHHT